MATCIEFEGKKYTIEEFKNLLDSNKDSAESSTAEKRLTQEVQELFESNPELANEVYEALGFKPDSKESNINIEEIEAVKAAIKNLRDEDGSIPDNKLGLFRKLHKKIRFLQNDLLSNINNAISEFIETNKLSESDARYFRKLATLRDNFQELVDDFNKAKNTNYTITEIMSFFSNDMNLQESIKNKSEDNINKNQEYEKKLLQGNNFEANKDYTANELDSFVQQHGSKQVKFIWNIIKAVAQKLGVTTRFMLDGTHKIPQYSAGHYLNGKIENKASLFDNPTQMARIIVHELVHGVTTYILKAVEQNNIKILSKLTTRQLNAVKKLNALFNELKKDKDFDDTYGTKNTHELLAELTNESFVEKLKAKNIFEKILETIFEIFNIPFNAYTESIKILEDLISNPIEDNRYEGDLGEGYSLYSQKNNQITSQQKQQAQQLYSSYLQTTNNPTIEGFKQWNNKQQQISELFESNPELANEVYEALGFKDKLKTSLGKELEYKDPYVPASRLKDFKQYQVLDEKGDDIGTVVIEYRGKDTIILHPKLNVVGKGYGKDLYKFVSNKFNVSIEEWNEGAISNSSASKKMWASLEKDGDAKRIVDEEQGDNFRLLNYTNQITPQQKQQAQQLYGSYLQTTNNPTIEGFKQWNSRQQQVSELFNENPELANAVYEALGLNIINESEITYTDEEGNPCAKMGLTNTVKGTNWKIVKDFKGKPKHSQGGVDITISDKGVSMRRGGKDIKAEFGLLIPATLKAQDGLVVKNDNPSFEDWYKTVPIEKNDTTNYNLRRAYELAPKEQLDAFVNNPDAHLYSVYENKETGEYEFMKSKNHPTLKYEIDWFYSEEGKEFRDKYDLDTSGDYYKYVLKK